MRNKFWGNIIQLAGVLLLGSGVTCEIVYGGDIFLIIITVGCVIFTIGTKIKGA